jgi:fructoselysine 6-kinase
MWGYMMKLIGVGDNVVDFYKDRGEIFPGGNALNVAVFSKRNGVERSSYMGIIGDDEAGDLVLNSLEAENIDISRIRRAYGPNWESVVTLNEEGDRVFVGSNKGGVQSQFKLNFTEEDLLFIATHDLMHTSVYSRIEKELPVLSERVPISFDFSSRRDEEYIRTVCPYLQYAFFSGSDLSKSECIDFMHYIGNLGTPFVGMTRGGDGALFLANGKVFEQSIHEANVIDTLGAGDSFIAMFLTQFHQYHNIREAMRLAAETAAKVCEYYGAFGYGLKKDESVML